MQINSANIGKTLTPKDLQYLRQDNDSIEGQLKRLVVGSLLTRDQTL